jgi:hypothetical protein
MSARIRITVLRGGIPVGASTDEVSIENVRKGDEIVCESIDSHTTYNWSLVFTPDSPNGTISSSGLINPPGALLDNCKFVIDNEGAYLIRLVVDAGLATESTQFLRVRMITRFGDLKLVSAGERRDSVGAIPADIDPVGWADNQNQNLQKLLAYVRRLSTSGRVLYVDANRGRKAYDPTQNANDTTNMVEMPGPDTSDLTVSGVVTDAEGFADFSSISSAIDYANNCVARGETALSADHPYVILVQNGVYTEDVHLIPNIHLVSADNFVSSSDTYAKGVVVQSNNLTGGHTFIGVNNTDSVVCVGIEFQTANVGSTDPTFQVKKGIAYFIDCTISHLAGTGLSALRVVPVNATTTDECSAYLINSYVQNTVTNANDYAIKCGADCSYLVLKNSVVVGQNGIEHNVNYGGGLKEEAHLHIMHSTVMANNATGYAVLTNASDLKVEHSYVVGSDATKVLVIGQNQAKVGDIYVKLAFSEFYNAHISFDTRQITGVKNLQTSSCLYDSYIFPDAPPTFSTHTQAKSLKYENNYADPFNGGTLAVPVPSQLGATDVQDAIDDLAFLSAILGAFGTFNSLDVAYDGVISVNPPTLGSGDGRRISADQGAVVIQSATTPYTTTPISGTETTPLTSGDKNGYLQVEGNIELGKIDSAEMSFISNYGTIGSMLSMGSVTWNSEIASVASGTDHRSLPSAIIQGNSDKDGLLHNYNVRVQTKSTSNVSNGSVGWVVLQGGDSLEKGANAPHAGDVYIQGGSYLDSAFESVGGNEPSGSVHLIPGTSTSIGADQPYGYVKVINPTASTSATLLASALPNNPTTCAGEISWATPMGVVTATITVGMTPTDVVNAINNATVGAGLIFAQTTSGFISLTCVSKGVLSDVVYVGDTDSGNINADLGDFQISSGATYTAGTDPQYVNIHSSAMHEITIGEGGTTGPMIYNSDTGKLTVPGLLDPTGLIFVEENQNNVPTGANEGAIFVSDGTDGLVQNNLYFKPANNGAPIDLSAVADKIELTDLSVALNQANGNGSLTYDNTTGIFTFTPADVSGGGLSGSGTQYQVPSFDGSGSLVGTANLLHAVDAQTITNPSSNLLYQTGQSAFGNTLGTVLSDQNDINKNWFVGRASAGAYQISTQSTYSDQKTPNFDISTFDEGWAFQRFGGTFQPLQDETHSIGSTLSRVGSITLAGNTGSQGVTFVKDDGSGGTFGATLSYSTSTAGNPTLTIGSETIAFLSDLGGGGGLSGSGNAGTLGIFDGSGAINGNAQLAFDTSQHTLFIDNSGSGAQGTFTHYRNSADGTDNWIVGRTDSGELVFRTQSNYSNDTIGSFNHTTYDKGWSIDTNGNFIPTGTSTLDIGSNTNRVQSIYVDAVNSVRFVYDDNGTIRTYALNVDVSTPTSPVLQFNGSAVGSGGGGASGDSITDGVSTLDFDVNNNLQADTHFLPTADSTYDLGSASLKWNSLYLAGSTIFLGTDEISSVSGDLLYKGGKVASAKVASEIPSADTFKSNETITASAPITVTSITEQKNDVVYNQNGTPILTVSATPFTPPTITITVSDNGQGSTHWGVMVLGYEEDGTTPQTFPSYSKTLIPIGTTTHTLETTLDDGNGLTIDLPAQFLFKKLQFMIFGTDGSNNATGGVDANNMPNEYHSFDYEFSSRRIQENDLVGEQAFFGDVISNTIELRSDENNQLPKVNFYSSTSSKSSATFELYKPSGSYDYQALGITVTDATAVNANNQLALYDTNKLDLFSVIVQGDSSANTLTASRFGDIILGEWLTEKMISVGVSVFNFPTHYLITPESLNHPISFVNKADTSIHPFVIGDKYAGVNVPSDTTPNIDTRTLDPGTKIENACFEINAIQSNTPGINLSLVREFSQFSGVSYAEMAWYLSTPSTVPLYSGAIRVSPTDLRGATSIANNAFSYSKVEFLVRDSMSLTNGMVLDTNRLEVFGGLKIGEYSTSNPSITDDSDNGLLVFDSSNKLKMWRNRQWEEIQPELQSDFISGVQTGFPPSSTFLITPFPITVSGTNTKYTAWDTELAGTLNNCNLQWENGTGQSVRIASVDLFYFISASGSNGATNITNDINDLYITVDGFGSNMNALSVPNTSMSTGTVLTATLTMGATNTSANVGVNSQVKINARFSKPNTNKIPILVLGARVTYTFDLA